MGSEGNAGAGRTVHSAGLEAMTEATRYRRSILRLIGPHLGGRTILEVGAGLGDLAAELQGYERLILTDVDPHCLSTLRSRFRDRPEVQVQMLDLLRDEPLDPPADTAIAINVLEHIAEDRKALATLARSVVPGGTLVLFVPGYPSLYGPYDRAVGHVRRYTPSSLRALVESVGLAVEVLRPVNFLGGLAWWAAVRVGGCSAPRGSLVRIYDALVVPITSWIERRWTPPFGQSVFCVARVPGRLDPPTAS